PEPTEPTQPTSPDPYRGPRNPGRPPPGYRTVYSQGSPRKEGARPGLEPIAQPAPPDEAEAVRLQLMREGWRSFLPPAEKETGCGASRQSPPQPAEVHSKCVPAPFSEHTVKVCPRQGIGQNTSDGQCPPRDSNPEPAD